MIKNIYDKDRKHYKHKYYCDMCFDEISEFGEICRNHRAIKFDLCSTCKEDWDRFGELEEELKGETNE